MNTLTKILAGLLLLTGCVETAEPLAQAPVALSQDTIPRLHPSTAVENFKTAIRRIEPRAERLCADRLRGQQSCDYRILVDDRPDQPPGAFQTIGSDGRPLLVVTEQLIFDTRNIDEIAFVVSHEAAHHIAQHLAKKRRSAMTGALLLQTAAILVGAQSAQTVSNAGDVGAFLGNRAYSKEFELEADQLGAVIAHNAGFDAVRGAAFFTRIPDPGDQFLGTHPPNASRIETVRRAIAGL